MKQIHTAAALCCMCCRMPRPCDSALLLAFLSAFAGVGLCMRLRDLSIRAGGRFWVGVLEEIFLALVTLGLVSGASRLGDMR